MNLRNSDSAHIHTVQRVEGTWRCERITRQQLCTKSPGAFDMLIAFLATEAAPARAENVASDDITNHFKIPASFWTPLAQEASGFLGVQDNRALKGDPGSYSSFFRFLVKEPAREPHTTTAGTAASYHWHKAAFFTSWQRRNASVILCFDLPPFLQKSISRSMTSSGTTLRAEDPFAVHTVIVEQIAELYNNAVWAWRDLVRGLEQNRVSPHDYDPQPNYAAMHEMARHVIHSTEMLEMALEVVAGMISEHTHFFSNKPAAATHSTHSTHAGHGLRYQRSILKCLHLRSQALNQRLKNEINLAINVVAQHDSHVSVRIGEATQVDSAAMKTISILGLAFLPGTFFCAFFSMSFFNFSPGISGTPQRWVLSDKFWVFWATTVPVTVAVVLCWVAWQRTAVPGREGPRQQRLDLRKSATEPPIHPKRLQAV